MYTPHGHKFWAACGRRHISPHLCHLDQSRPSWTRERGNYEAGFEGEVQIILSYSAQLANQVTEIVESGSFGGKIFPLTKRAQVQVSPHVDIWGKYSYAFPFLIEL